jgi:methyl-galactoside transport system ATP-binding protein/inositol transport system ATP-binding protein
MQDIVKRFSGVTALDGVSLKVRQGTVHALMGENGAGKSVLMKCLFGIYHADAGIIRFNGREVSYKSVIEALEDGIAMVQQEISPVFERPVYENFWLGRIPLKNGLVDHKKMRTECAAIFESLGLNVDINAKMKDLTVAKMQMVEIAKAVSRNARLVVMDEPTSTLTESEVRDLFRIIKQLKDDRVAVIFISHKMDEIFRISDDITILRDGSLIHVDSADNLDIDKVITYMVGREINSIFPKTPVEIGEKVLEVHNLCAGRAVKDVSFDLHRGEILGFAGLVGAGRTEVVECLFGMRAINSGKIVKDGKEVRIKSPEDAIHLGIGMLTEDRRGSGIFGLLDVTDNITVTNWGSYGLLMNHKSMRKHALDYIQKLRIKTTSEKNKIMNLSGGNQQKALLARWLLTAPDILIVDEPTVGIDIGAKIEIHQFISKIVQEGKAVILISSEMQEVVGVADRIIVMHEGEMTGILDRSEFSKDRIMAYAVGDCQNTKNTMPDCGE